MASMARQVRPVASNQVARLGPRADGEDMGPDGASGFEPESGCCPMVGGSRPI